MEYQEKIFGYEKSELPAFAISILTDKKITNENKLFFIKKFLIEYLNDRDFMKSVQGWYLLFRERKYKGVYEGMDGMNEIIEPGEVAKWYKIGKSDLYMKY